MYNNEYVKEYIELLLKDEELYFKDYLSFQDKISRSNAIYKGEPVPALYQGFFYSEEEKNNFINMSNILVSITRKITEAYLNNSEFRKLFNFPKELEELILHNPGYDIPAPMARYDMLYGDKENYKFCEFNTDGTSGMNEDNIIGNLLMETLAFKEFKKKYKLNNVELFTPWVLESTNIYKQKYEKKPNIAIVDFLDLGISKEFDEFKNIYNKLGFNCEIIDVRDLRYLNGKLVYNNYEVDLIYRRMVTSEFMKNYGELTDFIKAYYDNAFMMLGSFRSQIMHSKIIFTILQNDLTKSYLNDEENKFIDEHFLPTFILKNEKDIDILIKNKDSFILKPADEYASKGVYAGRDFNDRQWKEKIYESLNLNYIYQEYYDVKPLSFVEFTNDGHLEVNDFTGVIGMYMYNEKFIAPYTRIGKNATVGGKGNYYSAPNIYIK
ncbi:glutathionylspermidine synthase [Anaerosphaera multitolerans]|uniref:Glutathionylspermidine synthase n=1 Tax=Anaerosphaera multitolerans TaxID=2487351 RepID=A0A437S4B5_9FIRM|nr:glutathionylspermidine synthase [Anaerosphaera multitolerans]RVU53840.1 glutathionylspermidine synthase [Anaerosphaera multitolerans]